MYYSVCYQNVIEMVMIGLAYGIDYSGSVTTGSPCWLGWNRDGLEVGEILTTVNREFSGCAHHCAGKLKHRECHDRFLPVGH